MAASRNSSTSPVTAANPLKPTHYALLFSLRMYFFKNKPSNKILVPIDSVISAMLDAWSEWGPPTMTEYKEQKKFLWGSISALMLHQFVLKLKKIDDPDGPIYISVSRTEDSTPFIPPNFEMQVDQKKPRILKYNIAPVKVQPGWGDKLDKDGFIVELAKTWGQKKPSSGPAKRQQENQPPSRASGRRNNGPRYYEAEDEEQESEQYYDEFNPEEADEVKYRYIFLEISLSHSLLFLFFGEMRC